MNILIVNALRSLARRVFREGANAKLMFNNLIPLSMKCKIVLLIVALVGTKMVVVNADNPSQKSIAVTDDEGHFSMTVPENLDTSDLVDVFASNGARVVRYRETSTGILIVVETSKKRERALAQK